MGDHFKMPGIHAIAPPAEMIELESIRHRAASNFIAEPMRRNLAPISAVHRRQKKESIAELTDRLQPWPTGIWANRLIDMGPEMIENRPMTR
jgi:hypothetical protein